MNLRVIEEVVRRAFTDEDFRRELVADPAGVLARYALGEDERRALTAALATPGGVTLGWYPGFWWI
jgi:hypothetical protein